MIMPEHVHLLILPRDEHYSVSRILAAVKIPVARRALAPRERAGRPSSAAHVRRQRPDALGVMRDAQPNGKIAYRFWQRGGGYDRNIVQPGTVHATIEYLHANPVRRGLAASPEEWQWSGAGHFVGRQNVPLIPDVESIPPRDLT